MWTPKEIRKLIALLAGIGLEIAGIILLINQVKSTGSIDINSSIISGKVESGSAGIFLCFIGLIMIVLSIFGGKETVHYEKDANKETITTEVIITSINPDQKRSLFVITIMTIVTLILLFGGDFLNGTKFKSAGVIFTFGIFSAIITGMLILIFIVSYLDTDEEK